MVKLNVLHRLTPAKPSVGMKALRMQVDVYRDDELYARINHRGERTLPATQEGIISIIMGLEMLQIRLKEDLRLNGVPEETIDMMVAQMVANVIELENEESEESE